MKTKNEITNFIKECFDLYLVNDPGYFYKEDNYGFRTQKKLFNGHDDDKIITEIANILGVEYEDIINCNQNNIFQLANKYPFFLLINEFNHLRTNRKIFKKGSIETSLLSKLFPENFQKDVELQIDYKKIKKKLEKELIIANEYFPGIYHQNATIEDLNIDTSILFSFPQIQTLLKSLLEIFNFVKNKFFYILDNDLSRKEIAEYNILASAIQMVDTATLKTITYDYIKKHKEIFKEEFNKYKDFNFIVKSNFFSLSNFTPWEVIEFTENRDIAQELIDTFPHVNFKSIFSDFSLSSRKYICFFHWSDKEYKNDTEICYTNDDDDIEYDSFWEVAYVDKSPEEIKDIVKPLSTLHKWSISEKLDGLKPAKSTTYSQEEVCDINRINKKLNNVEGK